MSIIIKLSGPYQEIEPPEIVIGHKGQSSGRRTFLINWQDQAMFSYAIMGCWLYTSSGSPSLQLPPASYPGWPQLLASKFTSTGFTNNPQLTDISDINNSITTYSHAKVVVDYTIDDSTIPHPQGTSLEISRDVATEYVSIPGPYLFWGGDIAKVVQADMQLAYAMGAEDIEVNWSKVPAPPWSTIENTKSCVNSTKFANIAAGKLLFMGAGMRQTQQLGQVPTYNLSFKFKARSIEWNQAYRPPASGFPVDTSHFAGGFDYPTDINGNRQFASVDFNTLFQFGS